MVLEGGGSSESRGNGVEGSRDFLVSKEERGRSFTTAERLEEGK